MPRYNSAFGRQLSPRNPGKYRSLLTLEPSAAAQSSSGDVQPEWPSETLGPMTVRGLWSTGSRRQNVISQTRFDGVSGVWEIPWVPNLTTAYRVVYSGRYYRIVGIDNIEERNRELHLYCVEDEGAKGI